jgi:hypothetical protein
MGQIWKYEIPMNSLDEFILNIPIAAKILTVQIQNAVPVIWAIVDEPYHDTEERKFKVIGTGHEHEDLFRGMVYIGTFHLYGGKFIGHLFELIDTRKSSKR